jgi:uncharacterized membrane protein YbhN (UPF0104 family)
VNSTAIRKALLYIVFLGLACVLMYYLYRDVNWEQDILPNIQTASWPLVVLSFALGYTATVLRGLRWNIILEPLGYKSTNWTLIHSVAFGYAMNNLVPRSGELARCTLLNRSDKIPVDKLIGTVILERIVDFILLGALLALAFLLHADALHSILASAGGATPSEGPNKLLLLGAAMALFVGGLYVLYRLRHISIFGKIWNFLVGVWDGIRSIMKLKQKMLFIVYSLGIWVSWTLMTFAILKALQATNHMTLADTIFFMGAGSLGMVVPTPGGAGAYHFMAELAFKALGYEGKVGKIFALISWSAKTTFDIIIGFVGFFIVTSRKIKV